MELYKDEDYQAAKRGMLLRFAVLALILAATVVLLVLFVTVWRNEVAAMAVCMLGAVLIFFLMTMKVLPWFHYWRYQADIRRGRTHEMDCRFISLSEGERVSDGVSFRELVVELDKEEEKNERGEKIDNTRLLFWDADKKAPELKENQLLHIRAFGNYVVALETDSLKGGSEGK